jgi:hypothetical protein
MREPRPHSRVRVGGFLKRLLGAEAAPSTDSAQVSTRLTSPERLRVDSFTRLKVVGESHYQDALLAICGSEPGDEVRHECFAELVPEPENRHDANAVRVEIEGRLVGHLNRADAAEWQPRLIELAESGQPVMCPAFAGCTGAAKGNPNIGVSLKIPITYT